jgi:hypothetical protein
LGLICFSSSSASVKHSIYPLWVASLESSLLARISLRDLLANYLLKASSVNSSLWLAVGHLGSQMMQLIFGTHKSLVASMSATESVWGVSHRMGSSFYIFDIMRVVLIPLIFSKPKSISALVKTFFPKPRARSSFSLCLLLAALKKDQLHQEFPPKRYLVYLLSFIFFF